MTGSPHTPAVPPSAPTHGGGPAPTAQRILAQARFEAETLLRNGEQLLVSVILPLGALVGLALTAVPDLGSVTGPAGSPAGTMVRRIDLATPGVLAMCVVSAAFVSQAIALGFDRRYAVLRYLGTTPLGRGGLLAGKALATLVVELVQLVVIGAVALALGWHPVPAGVPVGLLFGLLGTWVFVALAMLVGGTLRAEAVLALANLIWVLLVAVGGLLVPASRLPGALGTLVDQLPSAALGDGLRTALAGGGLDGHALVVLVVWGAVATLLSRRLFRWSDG